jgi:hypothetical protein
MEDELEEDDDDEEVDLRIPGSFSFENVGGGAAEGVGTDDPFDAVGMLGICDGACSCDGGMDK